MYLPTPEQERVIRAVRDALPTDVGATAVVAREHYAHWEDESHGEPPRAVTLGFAIRSGPFRVHCRTTTDERIGASFAMFGSANDERGPYHLRLDDADVARLRARGWRPAALSEGSWPLDTTQTLGALEAIRELRPMVLLPEDLPPGQAWPWIDLIQHGLFADDIVERAEVGGKSPIRVTTRVGEETHTLLLSTDDDALLAWWFSAPRALRPW